MAKRLTPERADLLHGWIVHEIERQQLLLEDDPHNRDIMLEISQLESVLDEKWDPPSE